MRRRIMVVSAIAAFALAVVGSIPTGAQPRPAAAHASATSPPAAKTPIKPVHGAPFVPKLGDWEGRANGFPVSFELLSVPRFKTKLGLLPYGFTNMVVLEPNGCPPNPGDYSEDAVTGGQPATLGRHGGFVLTRFGFDGGLAGTRSALLAKSYRLSSGGRCSGRLVWHLHPANRAAVPDGRWKAHFSDGESSAFTVLAGGRLATKIALPHALARCGGPVGALDVFIGARGNAAFTQSKLQLGVHFSGASATGKLSVPGASCRHASLTMTASRG
jgi:hypothetical protein